MQTTTTSDGTITVQADDYTVTIRPRRSYERLNTGVFVADAVAEAADSELARLSAEEANLGDLRWCPSVREGGSHPEVDALYVALNDRIMATKTEIAREVVTLLDGVVDGEPSDSLRFSRRAGCETCDCSPGVTVPGSLRIGGDVVDIWVEAR
jgi:hypothetical protein